ncbi:MAG: ABC transporter substrate-binding protein [Thermomicrobiales bacterium]
MFKEYVPATSVSLERNPNYREAGLPYLDGIEAVIASDDTARTGALIQGAVDFIEYAPLRDVDMLEETDGLTVAGDELTNIRYLRHQPRLANRSAMCECGRRLPW